MSIPKSSNITNDIMCMTSQTIQPQSEHSKHLHRSTNSVSSINSDSKNHNNNNSNNHLHLHSDMNNINRTRTLDGGGSSSYSDPASANHHHHHHHYCHNHNYPNNKAGGDLFLKTKFDDSYDCVVYNVPQTSPTLVSPVLTYSLRGFGVTLSPSTPYVGFGAAPEAALNGHEKFQG
ncbi:hypothetical protein BT96DRAFT_1003711 [Gymnopus androsaceus JB14]|uniref:Uncharacterized protein n=1 Tax=Gymnopus androsaceus JB14 TaxID=1447944 RepID=A0A6A4GV45_9AGAR|nr:hypothetical protein BT96DRAFT_1003711 [Gymnopus androsaceus JB14]